MDLVRTDVSEELSASFIRVRIGELETMLALTDNRSMLRIRSVASVVSYS
jgi:hypothetical protein